MWIDSHCHVTADRYDEDRDAVLERAFAAGVGRLICVGAGYGLDHNQLAIDLAERDARIFATAGVHPHDAQIFDPAARDRIRVWLDHPRVVAVGECGLDYYYENSPREAQRHAFAEQVALARETGLPVSLHVRDRGAAAYEELLDIWQAEGRGDVEGVLHCYTHDAAFATRALDQRLRVSFSGIVTFKRAGDLRDVVRALPLDALLVETDAPFLAPEGHRGRRNEPAWVVTVGETLAQVHGVPLEEVARVTTHNAETFYRLPEQPEQPETGA